jgi:shikimate kinase
MVNIILTGFMGTGKSSVGRSLASVLGYKYIDIDSEIVAQEKRTINEIFSENGEDYFRSVEKAVLQRVLNDTMLVVSTGGGVVIEEENRLTMRRSGIIVNLTAPPSLILQRLADDDERPLLREEKSVEKIRNLMMQRERFYADADIRIDTTGKNIEDVVHELLMRLESGA